MFTLITLGLVFVAGAGTFGYMSYRIKKGRKKLHGKNMQKKLSGM